MSVLPLFAPDLRTGRLRMRPLAQGDVDALHSWQSDAEVTRYLPYSPRSVSDVADFVLRFAGHRELRTAGDRVVYAIVPDAATTARIGTALDEPIGELHVVVHSAGVREFELGWVLTRRAQGRGLAHEAAAAAVETLFAAGAHRIRADLDPRNLASSTLCARLGMRQEALFRQDFPRDGGWEDTAIWAIVEGDPYGADLGPADSRAR